VNILFVTTKNPFPLNEGRALRTYNLIRETSKRHRVTLCTFVQSQEELAGIDEMRKLCAEVHYQPLYLNGAMFRLGIDVVRDVLSHSPILATKYRVPRMIAQVGELVRGGAVDLVHLDMLHLGDFLPICGDKPVVLVEHNVESVLLRRRVDNEANPFRKAYFGYQYRKLRDYEARICGAVDHVITVSDLDAEVLRGMNPRGRYTTIANGVDCKYFRSQGTAKQANSLIYVGGLSWYPNLDAMRFFCTDILPRIRQALPDATLTVVGKLPNGHVPDEFGSVAGVHFTGLVDDVRPFIDRAAAYVVPLRVGGGTRLKILDGLSMGQSIITTSVGCEGLAVQGERDLLIADDAETFARQVVRVLRDEVLRDALSRCGRKLVEESYEWGAIARDLDRLYESVLAEGAVGPRFATADGCGRA
jgi:glycosyltransferase involved in cell wall biosynthesis